MNITKNNKYLPEQTKQHQNLSLLISSDLEPSALAKILSTNTDLINKIDNKKETFLSYALQRKKVDVCAVILALPELDLTYRNRNGDSYLHIATYAQCYTIVKELIDKGMDINMQNNQGNAPLHLAMINNDDLIKQLLINEGADDSIKNNNDMTPEMLKEMGRDPFEEDYPHVSKEILFNTNEEKNKSLQIDWSDGNVNPRLYISSIQANEKDYAKSFINKHHNVVSSTETRYNSGEGTTSNNKDNDKENEKEKEKEGNVINNFASDRLNYESNEEVDEDLFDLTNSNNEDSKEEESHKEIDDAETIELVARNSIEDYNGDEEEDLVNTRYSANCNIDNDHKPIKKGASLHQAEIKKFIPKSKNDDLKESHQSLFFSKTDKENIGTVSLTKVLSQQEKQLIETNEDKIPIEVENNFIFSAPNIDLQNHTSPPTASKPEERQTNPVKENTTQTTNANVNGKLSKNLQSFLSSIKMEQYDNNLIASGFDDLRLLIDQTKIGLGITDSNLREAGVDKPGDRAKILIKLQEVSGNFKFDIPKGVYHKCDDLLNCSNDPYIIKLSKWLSALKIDSYLNNFVSNGYHSLDLLQMQMESKQPLTNEILLDEIHIDKLGYRTRILNKLKEEGRILGNKLKSSAVVIEKKGKEEICECRVF